MSNRFFKAKNSVKLSEVAKVVEGILQGEDKEINSITTLQKAQETDITFFNNHRYSVYLADIKAAACLIDAKWAPKLPPQVTKIIVKNPYLALARLIQHMYGESEKNVSENNKDYIHPTAIVSKTAILGKDVYIGPGVVIEDGVEIGDNTSIYANTVVYPNVVIGANCIIHTNVSLRCSIIGDNCIIHNGVCIGQDGFGFVPNVGGHVKILQIGSVIIENNVEIGANACIDRGALEDTVIKEGTKIDNLVQIAHNVVVGKHCFIAAATGIAGSATIGDYVSIAGHSGLAPHINVGDRVQIGPMSGVAHDVEPGQVIMGLPATPFTEYWKIHALQKRLVKEYKTVFAPKNQGGNNE